MTMFVSHSGGLDSTATLLRAIAEADRAVTMDDAIAGAHGRHNVVAVGADYGQRHRVELERADAIREQLGVRSETVDLTNRLSGSALLHEMDVPHGHYAQDNMSETVVQGRNLAFITAIVGMTKPGDSIWIGVHGGDHFIYPDCRPGFVEPLAAALSAAYGVTLVAPFLHLDKTAVAASFADHLDVAAMTWSCYEGGEAHEVHCGRCGTCVERREAFHLAGLDDPTQYADPDFWLEAIAAHNARQG